MRKLGILSVLFTFTLLILAACSPGSEIQKINDVKLILSSDWKDADSKISFVTMKQELLGETIAIKDESGETFEGNPESDLALISYEDDSAKVFTDKETTIEFTSEADPEKTSIYQWITDEGAYVKVETEYNLSKKTFSAKIDKAVQYLLVSN